jgi:tetratricopeptide (TPR) repeat protein
MLNRGEKGHLRLIVAAAGVSALLSVLATFLAIGYIRQKELRQTALKETLRANEAATMAQDAANRRNRARDQAEELVGFILDDLRDELDQIRRTDLLVAAAEKAVAYFDNLPPELVTPESRGKHASVLVTLSEAHYQQGDHASAIAVIQRAIKLRKELAEADKADGKRIISLGRTLGELGLYQNQEGQHDAARETFTEILRLYQNCAPAIDNDGWWHHGLAKAHLGLGEVERLKKNYPNARAAYAAAITNITFSLGKQPEEISFLTTLMTAHNNTGVACMHEENLAEAEQSLRRSLEPTRTIARLEPKNRRWEKELATTLLNLGALLHKRKDYAQAEPFLREALAVRQGLASWDPKNTRWLRQLAHAWHRMAVFQFDVADNTNALASAQQSLAAQRRLLAIEPNDKQALQEIGEYMDKYRGRLSAAGMKDAALLMVRDAAAEQTGQ